MPYIIPRLAVPLHCGEHLILPSGNEVELLALGRMGGVKWHCAYCDHGRALSLGNGERNRVTLSEKFLLQYARPAT